jgi:hypothetical protein
MLQGLLPMMQVMMMQQVLALFSSYPPSLLHSRISLL